MQHKICAVATNDLPWQYYNRYSSFLKELNHPFRDSIVFLNSKDLSESLVELEDYPVLAFYHRDPLRRLYPKEYQLAMRMEELCLRKSMYLINKPDALSNSIKSVQLDILRSKHFNVAQAFPFSATKDLSLINFKYFPLFIRFDAGHDSYSEGMEGPFKSYEEIKSRFTGNFLKTKEHFAGKVAIQWIDTICADGFYRRYRAFCTCDHAIPGNLHVSQNWYIHGDGSLKTNAILAEKELFMIRKYNKFELNHFTSAIRALDLEFGAIDYSYNQNGEIMIWEVNPHPAFPEWTENEIFKPAITNLISNHYLKILRKYIR